MFKLIELSANMSTFHTIHFKDGLNIIMGTESKIVNNKQKTTNGLGKSLIIRIIDFCLASKAIKEWKEPLKGWRFSLTINVDQEIFTLERCIDEQSKVYINGVEYSTSKARELLRKFILNSEAFSFRQCINRFLRQGKRSYVRYFTSVPGEKESSKAMVLLYLLGLNFELAQNKIELKKHLDGYSTLLKQAKNDPSFRNIFGIDRYDIDLELGNIEFEIEKLTKEKNKSCYAENYASIQYKADSLSELLDNLHNEQILIESNIQNILFSLNRNIDANLEDVRKIYAEINSFWSEDLIRTLQEVEEFHCKLLNNRKEQLSKSLLQEKNKLEKIKNDIDRNNRDLNEALQFLNAHTAVDKYVTIIRQLDLLSEKKREILRIANIEKQVKTEIEKTKQSIAESNIKAQIYLDSVTTKCSELNNFFVGLTRRFYSDKKSALTIKNNDGDNQMRFDIDARITSDGSDGIQEIITFCFDWVLLVQQITKQGFIYHDSLLIANVERRQRETLFVVAQELCKIYNMQYIININEDQIDNFDSNVSSMIKENTILHLSDENVENKLLGIEVDLGQA